MKFATIKLSGAEVAAIVTSVGVLPLQEVNTAGKNGFIRLMRTFYS